MAPSRLPYKKRTRAAGPTKKFKPLVNIPVRAFSSSGMTAAERKSLADTLRAELECVRAMQRRIDAAEAAITPVQRCASLLRRLVSHKHGWVFREPVDAVRLDIPDYHDVVRHPMDLGTIGRRLESGGYSTLDAFAADVRLTFANALTYNSASTPVHKMAKTLSKLFEREWGVIERRVAELAAAATKRMTNEEKQTLSSDLQSCLEDMPKGIVDLLSPYDQGGDGREVEIDIAAIGDDTLIEVRRLLDVHLKEKAERERGNHQLRQSEVLNNSGITNSFGKRQDYKGDEFLDADIDIGGGTPPMLGHPPLQITDDAAEPKSSSNSNSSSSSNSDLSSSDDSDSGSSSGSDSDNRAPSPENVPMGSAQ